MSPICRTCLKEITAIDFVSLTGLTGLKQELAFCMPELNLDIVANAVVCTTCVTDLHTAYRFKNKCLETEQKIQYYVQSNTLETTQVELSNLINCNDGICFETADPLMTENIKREPFYNFNEDSEEDSYCNPPFEENFIKTEAFLPDLDNITEAIPNKNLSHELSDKSYNCSDCSKVFTTKHLLQKHKKVHVTKTPYKCTQCDFSATESKDLIRHVQTHITDHPVVVNPTTATTTKRKTFTIEDKVDLIRKLLSGKKISEVCRETGLATSTVCCIYKNKETILSAFEKNGPHLKRLRKPIHADVDEALFIWFKEQNLDVQITGPLLKMKALELARAMGNYDFICSSSWLDRFKTRYNICFGKKRS